MFFLFKDFHQIDGVQSVHYWLYCSLNITKYCIIFLFLVIYFQGNSMGIPQLKYSMKNISSIAFQIIYAILGGNKLREPSFNAGGMG